MTRRRPYLLFGVFIMSIDSKQIGSSVRLVPVWLVPSTVWDVIPTYKGENSIHSHHTRERSGNLRACLTIAMSRTSGDCTVGELD
jgi:hypothetical protein